MYFNDEFLKFSVCNHALGMEDRGISNWQITSSSQWDSNHAAIQGRLFFQAAGRKRGAWSARANNINQWLQIDLGCEDNIVTRVATQGRNAINQWVTKYMLQYSNNDAHFEYYREQGRSQIKVRPGPLNGKKYNTSSIFYKHTLGELSDCHYI